MHFRNEEKFNIKKKKKPVGCLNILSVPNLLRNYLVYAYDIFRINYNYVHNECPTS